MTLKTYTVNIVIINLKKSHSEAGTTRAVGELIINLWVERRKKCINMDTRKTVWSIRAIH